MTLAYGRNNDQATFHGILLPLRRIPIQVVMATWSQAGQLDYWVEERREWLGQVRGKDGKQRWIRASDLRPAP